MQNKLEWIPCCCEGAYELRVNDSSVGQVSTYNPNNPGKPTFTQHHEFRREHGIRFLTNPNNSKKHPLRDPRPAVCKVFEFDTLDQAMRFAEFLFL